MGKLQQAESFLRSQLKGGPVSVVELVAVAAREGIARRTLFRAAESLNVLRLPAGDSRRIVSWDLPEAVAQRKQALALRLQAVRQAARQIRRLLLNGLSWQFALSRMRKRWHWDDAFEVAVVAKIQTKRP